MIYLDNSATTRVDEEVINFMNEYNRKYYGNPSSLHKMGLIAERAIETARSQLAEILHVDQKSLFFVSGGTEGNNFAINSAIRKNQRLGKKIISSKIEHPSVLEVLKYYEETGYEVCYLNVDGKGKVDIDQLKAEMNNETILVSIMKVNNEVGTIQNLGEISKAIKEVSKECILHSDFVQALCKIPVNPIVEGVDILTFSGHKFHGPKGIGGVYVNKDLNLNPIIYGGGQEKGMRSGTENVPAIAGMAMAAQSIEKDFHSIQAHLKKLKSTAMDGLSREIEGIEFNSANTDDFSPHILNVSFEGLKSEVILHLLEKKDIYLSSGSACSSRKKSQSHVLKSMGLTSKRAEGSLRISFSKYNTLEEVKDMTKVLKSAVEDLRRYIRR